MTIIKSFSGIARDTVKIVTAPPEMVLDTARAITNPLADVATDLVKEVKEVTGVKSK